MSNADWYARKLGQPQAPRREATPPVQQPVHAQPVQYAQPPVPHPADPQFQAQERFDQWENMDRDQRFQHVLNNVPPEGPGTRDAQRCPECGGELLFSQRNSAGLRTTNVYPAPHCFNCGWPMVQAGSIGGELGGG